MAEHWLCKYAVYTRTLLQDKMLNRWLREKQPFSLWLSPSSHESKWIGQVMEVKQILPSPCELPLRGGVGWGGAIETSSWQLLLSLPCYLGLNTLWDPQLGKMVWGSIFLPFRKKASLLSFHAHRSLLLTCICWGMQTTLMSEGVGYLYFNHDREKERLIKGLPWV